METRNIILELRNRAGLSQDELAEKVFVTRQAVSRWENGETTPGIETLKHLSKLFNVSINTLLGSPRQLICQCCGMPLEDETISRETDGEFNEEYCKWCYTDGKYKYTSMKDLIDFCAGNMATDDFPAEQIRAHMSHLLPTLDYWKKYEAIGGQEMFDKFKSTIINEINELHVDGMPPVPSLDNVSGKLINYSYRMPSGESVKLLKDDAIYLACELECEFGGDLRFGAIASMDFILVFTHDKNNENTELVIFKHR